MTSTPTDTTYRTEWLPCTLIDAGDNDRVHFSESALRELADSIDRDGLAQPPTVRPVAGGRYEIVCGERRTRAMRDVLAWASIPCIVRPMSDLEASTIMLAENVARVDLDPVSEGAAYAKRIDTLGLTAAQVADMASVPVGRVNNRVSCHRRLSDAAKQDYAAGVIDNQMAIDLCRIDKDRQHLLLQLTRSATFTARQWADLIARTLTAQNEDAEMNLFDDGAFSLKVEEYALEVKGKKVAGKAATRALMTRLIAACADADLAREAQDWLTTTH